MAAPPNSISVKVKAELLEGDSIVRLFALDRAIQILTASSAVGNFTTAEQVVEYATAFSKYLSSGSND